MKSNFGHCWPISWAILVLAFSPTALARKLTDPDVNFLDHPSSSGIDFSQGEVQPGGEVVCVNRQKSVDKTEKDQMKECFVQNVTQCYYTYITEYTDAEEEKCEDFYWKSCKIVFDQVTFNATTRKCRRPLIKNCDDNQVVNSVANDQKIVCETFYETECNTTDIIPEPGDEALPVTFCQKLPRKICAPDSCRVEEGPETCVEDSQESLVQKPLELCDLQPQKHCSTIQVAVPKLTPERKCRAVEKEICSTSLVNPHEVEKTVFLKYCAKVQDLQSSFTPGGPRPVSNFLPTPSDVFQPTYGNRGQNPVQFANSFQGSNAIRRPQSGYGLPQGPLLPPSGTNSPLLPTYSQGNAFRNKRNNVGQVGTISVKTSRRRPQPPLAEAQADGE